MKWLPLLPLPEPTEDTCVEVAGASGNAITSSEDTSDDESDVVSSFDTYMAD